MSKKTVLLTGACGDVGWPTFVELFGRRSEFTVRVMDLPTGLSKKKFAPFAENIQVFLGDIRNEAFVAEACEDVDVVIHLAAIIPPLADEKPALSRSVNVGGTENIIKACQKSSKKPFIIYTSSISVYGDRVNSPWIKVGDAETPSDGDKYAESKLEAEGLLKRSGLPYTIFRLGAVLSPQQKLGAVLFHMPLETKVEIVLPDDVAFALVEAAVASGSLLEQLNGHIFNLAGGAGCRATYRELMSNIFDLVGLGADFLPETAFATKNFHCGYYEDTGRLQSLLHFQRHTLQDFYAEFAVPFRSGVRTLISWVRPVARLVFLSMSEPYFARLVNDNVQLTRYYGPEMTVSKQAIRIADFFDPVMIFIFLRSLLIWFTELF